MKKYTLELITILVISMGLCVLLPGFFNSSSRIVLPGLLPFAANTLLVFAILTLAYFGYKKTSR